MKILLAHNYYQQKGGEDVVFSMEGDLLEKHGHRVVRYTVQNAEIERSHPVKAVRQAIWNAEAYRRIRELIRTEDIDLLHVHNFWAVLSPSIYAAAHVEGVPVVQTLHNYRLLCPSSTHFYRNGEICEACLHTPAPYPAIQHACYRESRAQTAGLAAMLIFHRLRGTWVRDVDRYIALTAFARTKLIQGGMPAHKIVVKPNMLHPDPGSGGVVEGDFVLFAGRVSREKGILTLLDAWRELVQVPLKIVGDGPMLEVARAYAQKYPELPIDILGRLPREEMLDVMRRARFLVFPSEGYEGFPMVILEAFALSKPVIVSRLGSMAEIVTEYRTGLHFVPRDAHDLRKKILWAWSHPDEVIKMGINARKEFEKKYTAEKNYRQLMQIYRSLQEGFAHDGDKTG